MRCILFAAITTIAFSCNTYQTKYPYSLKDFRPELRKHLQILVNENIKCDNNDAAITYLKDSVSETELLKIFRSEHPVLRAHAFRNLIEKKSFAGGKLLLDNLDDTARVWYCNHKGEYYERLSDYYIYAAKSKTKIAADSLENIVLYNHAYLKYASRFALSTENKSDSFYSIVKERAYLLLSSGYGTEETWNYIYALSHFKRKEDIPFLAGAISRHWKYNANATFEIMINNPDTAYFKILEKYYLVISNPSTGEEIQANMYYSTYHLDKKYLSFLNALVPYKTRRSKEILEDILTRKIAPFYAYQTIGYDYRYVIYELLVKNQCAEYEGLIKKLKPLVLEHEKRLIKTEPFEVPLDTLGRNNYW